MIMLTEQIKVNKTNSVYNTQLLYAEVVRSSPMSIRNPLATFQMGVSDLFVYDYCLKYVKLRTAL